MSTASIMQWSAVLCNRCSRSHHLTTVTAGNLMFKYADDTYIVIPAANVNSRYAELNHVGRWAQNNIRLNRAKVCWHYIQWRRAYKPPEHLSPQIPDIRTDTCTSVKILGLMASPWRIICPPASTSAMSSASARSPSMPWNCCVVMAWVTTRWGTSTRLSSSLSYRTPHRHGGVRPIISVADKQRLKAITTCYIRLGSTQLTILRRPNSLLTYYGRQCFVMFCINYTTSKQHWTYNLRHIIGVTLCH